MISATFPSYCIFDLQIFKFVGRKVPASGVSQAQIEPGVLFSNDYLIDIDNEIQGHLI